MIRVRIAPSPTGIPHIGNTRTAFFNYLFSRHNKGKFIVRIEDTDQARIVKGAKEAIFEILDWLGLSWDEQYLQSERRDTYKEHVNQLLKKGLAYKDEGAVRFIVPEDREISWTDVVGNKKISFKTNVVEDFVILKSDGFPTYHLANVVDDHLMDISHVIRGDEWISSTPKHILLYEAFGWKLPIFAHLPIILGPDKTKLSKRHGAKSVLDYKKEGYLKEALLNFMGFLGWNPGGDKEIMNINEMIKLFDLEKVNTNSPIFDFNKLLWFNGEYIRNLDRDEFNKKLLEYYKNDNEATSILKNNAPTDNLLIDIARTRMKTLADFKSLIIDTFPTVITPEQKKLAQKLIQAYEPIIDWRPTIISGATIATRDALKVRMSDVYTVLTGKPSGLPFEQKAYVQGKEDTIEWLKRISS